MNKFLVKIDTNMNRLLVVIYNGKIYVRIKDICSDLYFLEHTQEIKKLKSHISLCNEIKRFSVKSYSCRHEAMIGKKYTFLNLQFVNAWLSLIDDNEFIEYKRAFDKFLVYRKTCFSKINAYFINAISKYKEYAEEMKSLKKGCRQLESGHFLIT